MMNIDKDILAAYIIALCVSLFFYYIYGNAVMVKTSLDMLCLCFGLFLPFILPVSILYKMRKEGKIDG